MGLLLLRMGEAATRRLREAGMVGWGEFAPRHGGLLEKKIGQGGDEVRSVDRKSVV